jgi:hypothetical protein
MASEKQISANRENAKKSTGPRSAAGKEAVSLNALKHGLLAKAALLPDEDENAFEAFSDDLLAELHPVGALESLLAEEIVNLTWRLQRASRTETGLFVRERAATDEEWARSERQAVERIEMHVRAFGERPLDCPHPLFVDEADLLRDANARRVEREAGERRNSDVGQLAEAFARDASGGNAFSKLARYETTIDRRLSRKLAEFEALQARRSSEG